MAFAYLNSLMHSPRWAEKWRYAFLIRQLRGYERGRARNRMEKACPVLCPLNNCQVQSSPFCTMMQTSEGFPKPDSEPGQIRPDELGLIRIRSVCYCLVLDLTEQYCPVTWGGGREGPPQSHFLFLALYVYTLRKQMPADGQSKQMSQPVQSSRSASRGAFEQAKARSRQSSASSEGGFGLLELGFPAPPRSPWSPGRAGLCLV